MSRSKLVLLAAVALAIAAFFAADGQRHFSLENVQHLRGVVYEYYREHTWQTVLAYFLAYIVLDRKSTRLNSSHRL